MIRIALLFILFAGGLTPALAASVLNPSIASVPEAEIPTGWRSGYLTEPVFGSRVLVVEGGTQHKQKLVLVHGLGQNGYRDWLGVMPTLAEHYHVVALDLPGFGLSGRPQGRYSPSQYARVVQWLIAKTGSAPVNLMGHSMGGAVALRYASSFPDTLNRLVLVSVAGVLERNAFMGHTAGLPAYLDQVPTALREVGAEQLQGWGGKLLELASRLPADPVELLGGSDLAWDTLLGDQPNANAALALVREDFSGALVNARVPALILWGEDDPVTPLRTGKVLAAQLPEATLKTFAATGHVPMQRREAFLSEVVPFLAGRPVQEAASGVTPVATRIPPGPQQGDLVCENQSGIIYSGHYRSVTLRNCQNIQLNYLKADSLAVYQSSATLEQVEIQAKDTALIAHKAEVTGTNVKLAGYQGIFASASRIDLAGTTIVAQEAGINAQAASHFIFSLSYLKAPGFDGVLHGVYRLGEP